MTLDPKALEAAVEAYNAFELGSDVSHVRNIVCAYLAASQEPAPVAYVQREVLTALAKDKTATGTICSGLIEAPFGNPVPLYAAPVPPVVGEDAVERAVRAWAYEEYYLAGGGVGSWHEKLSFNKPKDGRLDIRSIAPLYVAPPEGGVAQDLLAAIKQLMPSNLGSLPATMPDSATLPLDVTFGELRQAIAAIAKAEGRSDA